MKYALPILTGSAASLASKPKIGLETTMDYSLEPILEVGTVEQTAAGAQIALTGVTFTSGSTTMTHASATGFSVGDLLTGAGIPDGTTVATVTDATHLEMSGNSTAAVTGGTATVDLAGAANLTLDGTYVKPAGSLGWDMQLVLRNANPNTLSALRVLFSVTYSDNSSGTASAVFRPPSYAVQTMDMPRNLAVDLTLADPTKTVKAITGLTGIFGGVTGLKLSIWKLPEAASWVPIKFPVQKNLTEGSPTAVPIADRYDPAPVIKEGRGTMPMISLSAKHSNSIVGLARLAGQRPSIRFTTKDNDSTVAEVVICGDTFLDIDIPRGEANEDVTITAKGAFAKLAKFV